METLLEFSEEERDWHFHQRLDALSSMVTSPRLSLGLRRRLTAAHPT